MLAWATATSVDVVDIAPVVVSACIWRTLSNIFPRPLLPALSPILAIISAPQTSTAYNILGTTTLVNSWRMWLSRMPVDGLAKRRQAAAYLVPLAAAAASCSLKRSCSSMITPRNLCEALGGMTLPETVIGIRLMGTVFRGLLGSFRLRREAWTSAVLSISHSIWWDVLQSLKPFGLGALITLLQDAQNTVTFATIVRHQITPKPGTRQRRY